MKRNLQSDYAISLETVLNGGMSFTQIDYESRPQFANSYRYYSTCSLYFIFNFRNNKNKYPC